jgi:NACalpha-BTF3-like transcription factor
MHSIRYLIIKFDAVEREKLIIHIDINPNLSINSNAINQIDFISNKHVFEASVDASFANEKNRRSDEDYTFKLFEELID